MALFIPLTKIDEERRIVVGRAAQETRDKSNEIMDYASAKPAFERWSAEIQTLSRGLSKGNVRVMHNPRIVAGKITSLDFNDDEKAIDVVAKIVDDNEWKKVVEGVYTGFSVGGGYGPKWKDPSGATRYTPVVEELSLVDNPCIPTARIAELHKATGEIEQLRLSGRARGYGEVLAATPRSYDQVLEKSWAKGIASLVRGSKATTGRVSRRRFLRALTPDAELGTGGPAWDNSLVTGRRKAPVTAGFSAARQAFAKSARSYREVLEKGWGPAVLGLVGRKAAVGAGRLKSRVAPVIGKGARRFGEFSARRPRTVAAVGISADVGFSGATLPERPPPQRRPELGKAFDPRPAMDALSRLGRYRAGRAAMNAKPVPGVPWSKSRTVATWNGGVDAGEQPYLQAAARERMPIARGTSTRHFEADDVNRAALRRQQVRGAAVAGAVGAAGAAGAYVQGRRQDAEAAAAEISGRRNQLAEFSRRWEASRLPVQRYRSHDGQARERRGPMDRAQREDLGKSASDRGRATGETIGAVTASAVLGVAGATLGSRAARAAAGRGVLKTFIRNHARRTGAAFGRASGIVPGATAGAAADQYVAERRRRQQPNGRA